MDPPTTDPPNSEVVVVRFQAHLSPFAILIRATRVTGMVLAAGHGSSGEYRREKRGMSVA